MELEAKLKRIRAQIKYGIGDDVTTRLQQLWKDYAGTDTEKVILEIYALELLKNRRAYGEAIPILHRLLELDIGQEVRDEAAAFLDLAMEKEALQPSDPDLNNPEFLDFMRIVRSRELFAPCAAWPASLDCLIVREMAMAEKLAWHQGIEAPFQSWNHLRTQASKQIHTHYFENKIRFERVHDEIAPEIGRICEESLSPDMMNFYDDIYADLELIAMGKLVGVVPDLHVNMWDAYKRRLYPCGWQGDYPAGRICVFTNS